MGHLMGDGGHNNNQAYYTNTQEALIQKFLRLLQGVFGDVPIRVRKEERPPHKDYTRVFLGTTIIHIFRHLYQVDFGTSTARVPKRLFDLPQEYTGAYLQAFGDDEGHINDSTIRLATTNRELMQGIYELIQVKFPELGKFSAFMKTDRRANPKWADLYNIHIWGKAFASYQTHIGFTHPEKKQELERILTRRRRGGIGLRAGRVISWPGC